MNTILKLLIILLMIVEIRKLLNKHLLFFKYFLSLLFKRFNEQLFLLKNEIVFKRIF